MNIVALIKQVPDTETKIKLRADAPAVDMDGVTLIVNPYDEFAVEEALKIKENRDEDSEVTVVCLGDETATAAIRTCLAMGADKGVHITGAAFAGSDVYATAVVLSKAVADLQPDIVLCGKQAIDDDCCAVGIEMAEMLGMPHVHAAVKLEISDDGKSAVVQRETDDGKEIVEVSLPAVITCEKGLNEPRYASLKGIMRAKKKPVETKDETDLGLTADQVGRAAAKVKLIELDLPPIRQAGKKFDGEPADVVPDVVNLLHEEAKVI